MPDELVFLILGGMMFSLAWGVLGTVKTLMIKRWETKGGGDLPALKAQVDELQRRVDSLGEGVVMRLQDMEERLDFTERVVGGHSAERLPPPPSN